MPGNEFFGQSGHELLRQRLQQTQEFDAFIMNRSFSQSLEQNQSMDVRAKKEREAIERIKEKINRRFGERILTDAKKDEFKQEMSDTINELITEEFGMDVSYEWRRNLIKKIMDDILGFGPIQDLLEDPEITEIMVTRWNQIYVERNGRLVLVPEHTFDSEEHLKNVIEKIVQPIGRRINDSEPLVDGRLPDGSRVNATIPPISPDGATLTIRKFSKKKLTGEDYLKFGSLDERMLKFLELAVQGRCNIIVSGGTGSGKTTLLNMLSNFIPEWEAIVTIEDSCELQLNQRNVRRLEARPPSPEGTGEVSIRALVRNALRMRPDRIVVGEVRDGCVVDLFRAMSSGHDGSLTTIHANNPRDLIDATLPILFGMSDMKFDEMAQKLQICASVDLIVQIQRLRDGSRKITNITHVVGLGREAATRLKIKNIEPDKIYLQDIFKFKQTGIVGGKVVGKYVTTGYAPKEIIDKLESMGIDVPMEIFKADTETENDKQKMVG